MDKKTKVIIGPGGQQIITPKPVKCFSRSEREYIIQEYLSTSINKNDLWLKYTGKKDHGRLLDWMRQLGYDTTIKKKKSNFVATQTSMEQTNKSTKQEDPIQRDKSIEELTKQELEASILALRKELDLAKKDLEKAQIREFAYSKMIDIAEREFNIPIRKKLDAKPYKK